MMYSAQKFQPAKQSFWENKPTWTVYELVFLIDGYEPLQMDNLKGIDETGIKARLSDWAEWCRGCPGILPTDRHPMEAPIDKNELINWASGLSGVKIPTWILEIVEKSQHKEHKAAKTPELGDKEKENLLTTIGALALIVVEGTGLLTGDKDNPNITGLSNLCVKKSEDVPGMAKSTLDQRIKSGIDLLKERKFLASNK